LYANGRRQLGAEPPMNNQKHDDKLSIIEILYQNGYSEVQDDGFLIHDKLS
jgi:hypothetical protein